MHTEAAPQQLIAKFFPHSFTSPPRLAVLLARLFFLAVPVLIVGCTTVTHHPRITARGANPATTSTATAATPPPKSEKWNPVWWFGNVDEPVPPPEYRPGDPHRVRKYRWRNLGHNFTFYVIGVADREFKRTGLHPENVFAPGSGWNFAVIRCGICPLPFVSYHGRYCETYFGWRERGNFGMKLNFRRREISSAKPAEQKSAEPSRAAHDTPPLTAKPSPSP
mgnify:CR=1 FL=1